jgi:hypothetical protein
VPSARIALSSALVLLAAGAAQAAETVRYVILRDGKPVGSSLLGFERHGDRLEVTTDARVRVAIGFLTLYEYRHVGREIWHGDRLVTLETETDDNGRRMAVSGRLTGRGFEVDGRDGTVIAPPDIRPMSFWREDAVAQARLLDTETGRVVRVTAATMNEARTEHGGWFQRYRLSGDLKHPLELTYADGRLVIARLYKHGSDIEFRAADMPVPYVAAAGASGG